MKRNWLVICNAARARVLEESDRPGRWDPVADLVHPQSRMKGVQLDSDRPGHVEGGGHGLGSAAFVPRTDPREREHDRFAREVARVLDHGVAQGRCAGITLVASDPFLGQLKSHLHAQASKLLLRTVASDFTTLSDDEVLRRLSPPESAPRGAAA